MAKRFYIEPLEFDNVTVESSGYVVHYCDCTKSGYDLVGVVGFSIVNASSSGANAEYINVRTVKPDSTTSTQISMRNTRNQNAKVKIKLNALYFKQGE